MKNIAWKKIIANMFVELQIATVAICSHSITTQNAHRNKNKALNFFSIVASGETQKNECCPAFAKLMFYWLSRNMFQLPKAITSSQRQNKNSIHINKFLHLRINMSLTGL